MSCGIASVSLKWPRFMMARCFTSSKLASASTSRSAVLRWLSSSIAAMGSKTSMRVSLATLRVYAK